MSKTYGGLYLPIFLLILYIFIYLKTNLEQHQLSGKLPVRRVITGKLSVRRVISRNLLVLTLLTDSLPVMTLQTGNLLVMNLLSGSLVVMTLQTGNDWKFARYDPPHRNFSS